MAPRRFTPTNDRMIRDAVKAALVSRHADDDAVIVEELKTARGSGRLDIAVINGKLEGVEIKSDLDTLSRLGRQATYFGGAADKMTLVVGDRHLNNAVTMVPDWWSIVKATAKTSGEIHLKTLRRGRINKHLDPEALTFLLEREELVILLERFGLDSGIRTAPYSELSRRAMGAIRKQNLAAEVRSLLKRRAEFQKSFEIGAFGRNTVICTQRVD
ncbi:sce7726 family protein [Mesorhizobium sp. CCNWLY176]